MALTLPSSAVQFVLLHGGGVPKNTGRAELLTLGMQDFPFFSVHFLIHYGEYDILPSGSSSKRRATSERKQKT